MSKTMSLLILLIFSSSCARHDSFQRFYNQEKKEADIAVAMPKYMAMVAIPKETKEDIKFFLKGMKKIRLLYDHEHEGRLLSSFHNFAKGKTYTPYLVIKEDGNKINLLTKEDGNNVKEIILDIQSEDETIIVALMGNMDMDIFTKAMAKASDH